MLKNLYINVTLIESLEQINGYEVYKDIITKKQVVTFEDDDKLLYCSAILQGLL